jgi:hypothetical protein
MLQRTHRWLGLVLIIALAVACRPAGTAQIQDPKVTLARVEVVAYYAWPPPRGAPPPPPPAAARP